MDLFDATLGQLPSREQMPFPQKPFSAAALLDRLTVMVAEPGV